MRSSAIKADNIAGRVEVVVVGYGNPYREDDGVGPYVAALVRRRLEGAAGVRVLACRQLGPGLVEEFAGVKVAVLVDAGTRPISGGWKFETIKPDPARPGHVTHSCRPEYLAGLCRMVNGPETVFWLLTVQGERFGLGRGLTAASRRRAGAASRVLVKIIMQGGTGNGRRPRHSDHR